MRSRLFFGILLIFFSYAAQASPGLVDVVPNFGAPVAGMKALPSGAIAKPAEDSRKYKEPLPTWKDIEFSFGVKLGGGGDLSFPPSNTGQFSPNGPGKEDDYTFTMPLFSALRGGYNYSVGFFGDLRLFRYLGVESGVVLTRRTLTETTDWTYTADKATSPDVSHSEETLTWGVIRVPVMFRFIAPVGDNHIWFGAGPEFSYGKWARGSMEISPTGSRLQGEREKLQATHDGCTKQDRIDPQTGQPSETGDCPPGSVGKSPLEGVTSSETWLTFGFGYMIQAARNLKIPIDLRFGWNYNQPKDYYERLSFCPENLPCGADNLPTSATDEDRFVSRVLVRAQSSMYAELLVGLLYNLY